MSKLLKNSQQTHNVSARYDSLCPQCLGTSIPLRPISVSEMVDIAPASEACACSASRSSDQENERPVSPLVEVPRVALDPIDSTIVMRQDQVVCWVEALETKLRTMYLIVDTRLIKVVDLQAWPSSTGMLPISRSNETCDETVGEPSETLVDMSHPVSPDQVDLMELPCMELHGRVISHPPVTWSSLESAFRGVPSRSLGELGARLVQEEGSMNWSLEVSIQLSAEEGDQVFDNLMPGRSESPDWESRSIENESYD